MQTKTYFASSVPAALEVARQELGENALLVSSKPAPPQARRLGRLEVTFAWENSTLNRSQPGSTIRPSTSEANEIGTQLSALRVALGHGGRVADAPIARAGSSMLERLGAAGFSRQMAADIATGASRRSGSPVVTAVEELANRIPIAPFVEMKPGEGRTLAFIGPPGRGKTISLVKVAVSLGLARRVPVRVYCAGEHGIGAQEQAARFAEILGTPFQSFESLTSLNLALKGEGGKGLSLIDTPGISPADRSAFGELKDFFGAYPDIEKHLVLRADASSADILHMVSRFAGLTPTRLLFTGMDEAVRVAPVLEALARGGIPATFCGTGQRIPEDLEEVNAVRLARAAWDTADWSDVVAAGAGIDARFGQAAA